MNTAIKILISIFCLSAVIVLHELGHLVAAKLSGIRVKEFCLGFGPKIYEKKFGETSFKLKLLPIIGYVNISGMTESDENDPRGYNKKSIIKRIFTIMGGALANFLTAIIIFTFLFTFNGNFNKPSSNVLSLVSTATPASNYGLLVNDKILKINGTNITTADDMLAIVKSSPNKNILLTINREGKIIEKDIVLTGKLEGEQLVGFLGVAFYTKKEPVPVAFVSSIQETAKIIKDSAVLLPGAIKKNGLKAFSSPVGIAKLTVGALTDGFWFFVYLLGIIAASIGFVQLIPFPGLDGGWLIFLLYEAISRKKPSTKVVNVVQSLGVVVLLLFIALISIKDIFFRL
jgi:regulator of sigma E protease